LVNLRLRPNHLVLDTILRRRYELATLMGFRNYADYQLSETMAGSVENVRAFLDEVRRLSEPALKRAVETRLAQTSNGSAVKSIALYDLVSTSGTPGGVIRLPARGRTA